MQSLKLGALMSLSALVTLGAGCNEREFGFGIGTPPVPPVSRPAPSTLRLVEVALTPPAFVEVVNSGTEAVTLTGASVCTALLPDNSGCQPIADTTLAAGARTAFPLDANALTGLALSPPPSAGEIAVVAGADVRAYLAWGALPAGLRSTLSGQALIAEIPDAGAFVATAFPLAAGVALVREGTSVGCETPTQGAVPQAPGACAPASPNPVIRLTEVVTGPGSWVEIENLSGQALSLWGLRLCQPPTCFTAPRTLTVPAGGQVQWVVDDPALGGRQLQPDGELALLAPGVALEPATPPTEALYQSYVRFGAGTVFLQPFAVASSVWTDDPQTPTATRPQFPWPGDSLSLNQDAVAPVTASAWGLRAATPGAPNVVSGTPWNACSFPDPSGPAVVAPEVAVVEVGAGTTSRVVLENRRALAAALQGYTLTVVDGSGPVSYDLSDVVISAGARYVLGLQETSGCTVDRCVLSRAVPVEGELALRPAAGLDQYIRWGPSAPQTLALEAVSPARRWPAVGCAQGAVASGQRLELLSGTVGWSPADYRISGEALAGN